MESRYSQLLSTDFRTSRASLETTRELVITKIVEFVRRAGDETSTMPEYALSRDLKDQAHELIEASVQDSSADVRRVAFTFLATESLKAPALMRLVTRDVDGLDPFLDPKVPINEERVEYCARKTSRSPEDIWQSYEKLAKILPLKLERG